MNIIIHSSSMIPIYEQIMENIKRMIVSGELTSGDPLPSVRALSRELKISALTVKKAYDRLEEEGLTATIHGKGTYVTGGNPLAMAEEQRKEIERDLEQIFQKAKGYGLQPEEIRQILDLILEE